MSNVSPNVASIYLSCSLIRSPCSVSAPTDTHVSTILPLHIFTTVICLTLTMEIWKSIFCDPQDCPPDAGDFRAQQCSAHADVRYLGQYHEWLPVYNDPDNPCALKCKAKGSGLLVELAPKVLDGTRCYTESLDMCISGVCQVGGSAWDSIVNSFFQFFKVTYSVFTYVWTATQSWGPKPDFSETKRMGFWSVVLKWVSELSTATSLDLIECSFGDVKSLLNWID